MVRFTHWITTLCFFAMLVSGLEIVVSHPRFYWGETGNVLTPPLFSIPIPASRATVPTGYGYTLPDQNGWSRSLHFQAAWAAVFIGLLYFLWGLFSGHFRQTLIPSPADGGSLLHEIGEHLRFKKPEAGEASSYNTVQRLAYLGVIFVLAPLMVWTGLAMSPAVAGVFPWAVAMLGGQQSARTIHFFGTLLLVLFVLIHVVMVIRAGFGSRTGAMITGRAPARKE